MIELLVRRFRVLRGDMLLPLFPVGYVHDHDCNVVGAAPLHSLHGKSVASLLVANVFQRPGFLGSKVCV